MVTKRKVYFFLFAIFTLFVLFAYVFSRKYNEEIFSAWLTSYNNGDDAHANILANQLWLVDPQARAVYLAHVAVSDSIHLSGQAKIERISVALERLENAWLHLPEANERDVFLLKASLSAMAGDTRRANTYASDGCKLIRPMDVEKCIGGHYSFADPNGSRWAAVQLYEDASLYDAIGAGDKTSARFYEAVALKYFDLGQAHRMIDELVREGHFSDEMKKTYCNPASPPDIAVCVPSGI